MGLSFPICEMARVDETEGPAIPWLCICVPQDPPSEAMAGLRRWFKLTVAQISPGSIAVVLLCLGFHVDTNDTTFLSEQIELKFSFPFALLIFHHVPCPITSVAVDEKHLSPSGTLGCYHEVGGWAMA